MRSCQHSVLPQSDALLPDIKCCCPTQHCKRRPHGCQHNTHRFPHCQHRTMITQTTELPTSSTVPALPPTQCSTHHKTVNIKYRLALLQATNPNIATKFIRAADTRNQLKSSKKLLQTAWLPTHGTIPRIFQDSNF